MATYKTDFATAQDAAPISRTLAPSGRDVQQEVHRAVFTFTQTAAFVASDKLKLGSLNIKDAVIIPESCRIVQSSSSLKANVKIQSVNSAGNATDETGTLTIDGGSALHAAFARVAAGTNTQLDAADYLQLAIATVSGFNGGAANDTLQVEVAYRSRRSY